MRCDHMCSPWCPARLLLERQRLPAQSVAGTAASCCPGPIHSAPAPADKTRMCSHGAGCTDISCAKTPAIIPFMRCPVLSHQACLSMQAPGLPWQG